jgi:hypothetical protein
MTDDHLGAVLKKLLQRGQGETPVCHLSEYVQIFFLIINPLKLSDSACTICLNTLKLCILATECIFVCRVVLIVKNKFSLNKNDRLIF